MVRVEAGRPTSGRHAGRRRSAPGSVVLAHGRVGGAGAALPPRLRRVHRLHGRHRADPGAHRARSVGRRTSGVADLREMLYYLRRTADDRIAIGGGAMGIVCGARIRGRVADVAAAGRGGRARPDLAVPPARGRALRRRLERADGHHRPGAAVLRVGAGRHRPRRARLLGPRPHEHQARRQDPRLAGAARRRRVEPHAGRRPAARAAPARAAALAARADDDLAYEASDRAHEQGRRPGLLPRAVIAVYGGYAALNSATGRG